MANPTDNERRAPRRRRKKPGVPTALVIVLIIMALLMGALAGYAVARKTNPYLHELQAQKDRVTELENTLTLIGYPVDGDTDPEQWLYDRNPEEDALAALNGESWEQADDDDVWGGESLLDGTLPEDGEPVVVAEFDGGELMSTEVVPAYNDQLTNAIFAGHDADAVAEDTLKRVLEQLAGDKIIAMQAQELGLTELTDEDLNQIDAQAAESYERQLSDYIAFVGEDDRDAAAKALEEGGVTLASVTEQIKQNWWTRKYYDYTVKDVTVTDEEVQARYDALLNEQKADFDATPENFEYAHQTGRAVVYRPAGYRAVRDILIGFDSPEDAAKAADLLEDLEMIDEDEGALAQTQQALNDLYAPLEAKAAEAQQKLADGASFESLMDEYGTSDALKTEPLRSEGFYIADDSFVNSAEFVQGAMMLEQPEQVSSPLRSAHGVHLVQYIGDVTPGEVPLDEAREAVAADALAEKQVAYYDQQRKTLLDEAHVKYYPERLH